MIRTLACVVAVVSIAGSPLHSQRTPTARADEAAVRATLAKAIQAHHAGDAGLWLQTVADDVVLLLPGDTAVRGIRSAEAAIRQLFATNISELQVRIVDLQIGGDVAIIHTRDSGAFRPKAGGPAVPIDMKELLVLRRQKDASWKAAYVSVVPNSGAAVVQAGEPATRDVVYASAATARYAPVPGTPISAAPLFGDENADAPHGEFIAFPPNVDAGGWHTHTHTVNLVVLKGAYLYRDANGEKRVGAGEFMRIPGGHRHWSGSDAKDGAVFYMHQLRKMDQTPSP